MDCLFCKIVAGEIPSNIIYQDEDIIAFDDIRPKAPHHKLIIPRKHIATVNDFAADDANLIGKMVLVAKDLAKSLNVADNGYRLVFNCNTDGGQEVYHVHLHLLAGRSMHWPPG
jgi:histidine triad (HIT) family protein